MKHFRRKLIAFLCSLVFAIVILPIRVPKANAITNVWIEVRPRKVGLKGTYKFHFSLEKTLKVHEYIKLIFPKGTMLPPKDPNPPPPPDPGDIPPPRPPGPGIGGCEACQGLPIFDYEENSLKFNSHIELDPSKEGYRDITVTVPDIVGICNPMEPGFYKCKISTQAEPTPVESAPYEIVESKIGIPQGLPEVTTMPASNGANASYTIGFNVGRGGWLKEGDARIRIKFPEGTTFSKSDIPANSISINGIPLTAKPSTSKSQMTMITAVEIKDSGRVEIEINESAGIINPNLPGDYRLEVSTMPADPEWTLSAPYHIEKGGAVLRVDPNRVNKPAQYSFAFILVGQKEITPGDRVIVKFPVGSKIPKTLDSSYLFINNTAVSNALVNDLEVSLFSPLSLKSGDSLGIKIEKEAGIFNPASSGEIRLGYKLSNEEEFLYTLPVTIKETKLEASGVKVQPNNAGAKAKYSITLSLGDKGALHEGDYIGITFPDDTLVPQDISPGMVTMNGNVAKDVTVDGKTLKIYLSFPVENESNVMLQIEKGAGIKNPILYRADYTLSIFTFAEPKPVSSAWYTIQPPLPETTITFTGGTKGKNGWYIDVPLIGFICSDRTAKIYVFWDDKWDQKIRYDGTPKPPDPGQYESKLVYFAEGLYGVEEPKEAIVKVDSINPEFVLEYPKEKKVFTKDSSILLRGHATLIKTYRYGQGFLEYDKNLTINGVPLVIDDKNGFFSYDYPLKSGENKIVVRLEDEAGRYMEREYMVYSDTITPNLTISYPNQNSTISSKKVLVTGTCDDPMALVQINGEIVDITEKGDFSHELILDKVGKTKVLLEATDPVGNSNKKELEFWFGYTIVLKIGNKTSTTNEVVKNLNVAPLIQNGRTLVPFRFIGEQLNAKIDFMSNPLTKQVETVSYKLDSVEIVLTIGKTQALVNGKEVTLEVPPQIITGSTVVPLRFVTEGLGCLLTWEPKTQTITIQYPK